MPPSFAWLNFDILRNIFSFFGVEPSGTRAARYSQAASDSKSHQLPLSQNVPSRLILA